MFRLLLMFILATGCSSLSFEHRPFYHGSLVSSKWEPLAPRGITSNGTTSSGENIRSAMVSQAAGLLVKGNYTGDFGARDLDTILATVGSDLDWNFEQGLGALVSRARNSNAYHSSGRPKPGDIALFHNQWDANGNGENDDWLTGCGIILETKGPQFDAVARTARAPRRVTVRPDGPARRILDGQKINDFLRVPTRSDSRDTSYLAGQLFAGYIDIERLIAGDDGSNED
jgi:hypothetical protein